MMPLVSKIGDGLRNKNGSLVGNSVRRLSVFKGHAPLANFRELFYRHGICGIVGNLTTTDTSQVFVKGNSSLLLMTILVRTEDTYCLGTSKP